MNRSDNLKRHIDKVHLRGGGVGGSLRGEGGGGGGSLRGGGGGGGGDNITEVNDKIYGELNQNNCEQRGGGGGLRGGGGLGGGGGGGGGETHFKLIHPLTAQVSGPTCCGKTYLVKNILQRNKELIQPPPQRIIWLYKRWQPLYDIIQNTVQPPVEFIQGVPIDLDNDSFIDPNVRNLIVVDDLMSSMAKDPRFNEIFCEGAHHRNLSVIGINQNLFFSKDPTQRRNCHYMILFNNPIDKQQIMTLARQMYPGKSHIFMEKFDKATSRERGFLLVDLKPTTPEALRLRENILTTAALPSKTTSTITQPYSEHQATTVLADIKPAELNKKPYSEDGSGSESMPFIIKKPTVATQTEETSSANTEFENMPSCDDCGLVFDNLSDVQRHIKNWCPENRNLKRKSEERFDLPSKKVKRTKPDVQVWAQLIGAKVFRENKEVQNAIKTYKEQGSSQRQARSKAIQDNVSELSKDFRKAYVQLLINMSKLTQDPIHVEIMKTSKQFETDFGMNKTEALQQAVKLRKNLITDIMMIEATTSKDEEDNDDDEDEDDSDLESEEEAEESLDED